MPLQSKQKRPVSLPCGHKCEPIERFTSASETGSTGASLGFDSFTRLIGNCSKSSMYVIWPGIEACAGTCGISQLHARRIHSDSGKPRALAHCFHSNMSLSGIRSVNVTFFIANALTNVLHQIPAYYKMYLRAIRDAFKARPRYFHCQTRRFYQICAVKFSPSMVNFSPFAYYAIPQCPATH